MRSYCQCILFRTIYLGGEKTTERVVVVGYRKYEIGESDFCGALCGCLGEFLDWARSRGHWLDVEGYVGFDGGMLEIRREFQPLSYRYCPKYQVVTSRPKQC